MSQSALSTPADDVEHDDIRNLKVSDITVDMQIQPRDGMREELVTEYAEKILSGVVFPPVVVFYEEASGVYWLSAGFHRLAAYVKAGVAEVIAIVRCGSARDAWLEGFASNIPHGCPMTIIEKRKNCLRMLQDEELKEHSDRELARRCTISNTMVSAMRKNLARMAACGLTPANYQDWVQKRKNLPPADAEDADDGGSLDDGLGEASPERKRRQRSDEENIRIFGMRPAWVDQEYVPVPAIDVSEHKAKERACEFWSQIHGKMMDHTLQFPDSSDLFESEHIKNISSEDKRELGQVLANVDAAWSDIWKPIRVYLRMNGLLNDDTAPAEDS